MSCSAGRLAVIDLNLSTCLWLASSKLTQAELQTSLAEAFWLQARKTGLSIDRSLRIACG